MKIVTRAVYDMASGRLLEEDSYEYEGPVAECKSSGNAPQPVDPWTQAGAEYALGTGTASYNAGLNRTNTSNPLGSSTWSVSGGQPSTVSATPASGSGGIVGQPWAYGGDSGSGGFTGTPPASVEAGTSTPFGFGGSPPTYTQTTALAPQFESALQQPINTQGIPGLDPNLNLPAMVGGTRNAIFGSEMGYLQPEQQLASEQLDSQLAAEGATSGSPAYETEQDRLAREQTFQTNQAVTGAITGGNEFLNELYGLGGQSLNEQIAARNAPINEFTALSGAGGAPAYAATPDIASAFNQQYNAQLAGYNANTATNNANVQGGADLAALAYLFAFE